MIFPILHSWNLTPKQAIALQRELAARIVLANRLPDPLKTVAGVDVSYHKHGTNFHAAIVVLSYPNLQIIDQASAVAKSSFPYIPGLLSFRELPVLLEAFRKLQTAPDLVLVDGQGIAHPRRFGLASHLGLWLDLPTIGCAKSRLVGEAKDVASERGSSLPLFDRGDEIGRLLRNRAGVKPLFVSPGHLVDLTSAARMALACGGGYRLPEPTRQAHLLSNQLRLEEGESPREVRGAFYV
jgi:deoxyribonuclease V